MAEEKELRYDPATIETKMAGSAGLRTPRCMRPSRLTSGKPKYYVLEMLPYPSGQLHMGHVRNYSIGDALARHMWMRGYNVLHPMGWDAFGLPAENAALKNNTPPREWTLGNIAAMKRQMQRLGFGYDWATEVTTCLPDYYRWNQWFFLRMYEKGLAYRKKSKVNWCPECATVLANEQVIDGCCWRHEDTMVEQRDLEQWFLRITAYAQELLDGLDKLDGWPEKVRTMQRNWIGRSEGTEVDFSRLEKMRLDGQNDSRVHTRVDTIFGATSVQLAPEHPLVAVLCRGRCGVEPSRSTSCIEEQKKAREAGDVGAIEKHGVPTGRFAMNPYNGERVPIWVANYVLMDYGTGAIMSVPAHDERDFEFATKYGIPDSSGDCASHDPKAEQPNCPSSRRRRAGELRRIQRPDLRRGAEATPRGCRAQRLWRGEGHLSPERLGREPAALLGHADSHDSLRARRPGSGAGRSVAGAAAREDRDHAAGRLAAGARAGVCERHLPQVRRPGEARDRHDGHVRRFELVLLSLHRREERSTRRSIRRRRSTGFPSTSTSAAWSTPFCT